MSVTSTLEYYNTLWNTTYNMDVCQVFLWKGNLIDSRVWNTGETGDINLFAHKKLDSQFNFQKHQNLLWKTNNIRIKEK